MSAISIKHFGPIKEGYQANGGWLEIKKVTLMIGNQGSGKSTVAKLISIFMWLEKVLVRGDYKENWFTQRKRFQNVLCKYHRLENYFTEKTIILYQGNAYSFEYQLETLTIKQNTNVEEAEKYALPQIMYVPAERNFISTVKKPDVLKFSSDSLVEFVTEFDNAKSELKEPLQLPINESKLEYDKLNDLVNIRGDGYKLRLTEASSGFQSLVPLFLVSRYLATKVKTAANGEQTDPMSSDELARFKAKIDQLLGDNIPFEQLRTLLSAIFRRFNKKAFINIVEEPEQNLFPSSQQAILYNLLTFNNMNEGNKLIMTTHSPYLLNYLNVAIQAHYLKSQIQARETADFLLTDLAKIIATDSLISAADVAVYQLDERSGTINVLPNLYGIVSDKNYLNEFIKAGNKSFDDLLALEERL